MSKDVVFTAGQIAPDGETSIQELYATLRARREDTKTALAATGVFAESAFLVSDEDGEFLVSHIESADFDRVRELYADSDHELDQLHSEVLGEALVDRETIEPLFHAVR